jgi:ribosome-associated protein
MVTPQIVLPQSLKIPVSELHFRTSRSSGPGGQNVNKLETRVELLFDIESSPSIPEHLRLRMLNRVSAHLDASGMVRVVVQESRSQWKNKQLAIERLTALLKSAMAIPKKRVSTKPTKTAVEHRLRMKKSRSQIKRLRKVGPDE